MALNRKDHYFSRDLLHQQFQESIISMVRLTLGVAYNYTWWLQPMWKIWVKLGSSSQGRHNFGQTGAIFENTTSSCCQARWHGAKTRPSTTGLVGSPPLLGFFLGLEAPGWWTWKLPGSGMLLWLAWSTASSCHWCGVAFVGRVSATLPNPVMAVGQAKLLNPQLAQHSAPANCWPTIGWEKKHQDENQNSNGRSHFRRLRPGFPHREQRDCLCPFSHCPRNGQVQRCVQVQRCHYTPPQTPTPPVTF